MMHWKMHVFIGPPYTFDEQSIYRLIYCVRIVGLVVIDQLFLNSS